MFQTIVKPYFSSVLCWAREHCVDYSEFLTPHCVPALHKAKKGGMLGNKNYIGPIIDFLCLSLAHRSLFGLYS